LSPILYNLYTNDLPVIGCRKYIYAVDICLGSQAQSFAELGVTLDRTLSYKLHLTQVANKVKSCNNLLTKLAGSS